METKEKCLDTDILIDNLRGVPHTINEIKRIEENGDILSTTTINIFELTYGAYKTKEIRRNLQAIDTLLSRLKIHSFNEKAAATAAEIVANLEKEGNTIDFRDAFIAATAITNNATLYTRNIKHFNRVPKLKLHKPL